MFQLDLFLRIFVAVICGATIGYERTVRLKSAGIRTHILVAAA
ncbi:MgtC/SapB family protein, partial [Staphylococcus condimenti]